MRESVLLSLSSSRNESNVEGNLSIVFNVNLNRNDSGFEGFIIRKEGIANVSVLGSLTESSNKFSNESVEIISIEGFEIFDGYINSSFEGDRKSVDIGTEGVMVRKVEAPLVLTTLGITFRARKSARSATISRYVGGSDTSRTFRSSAIAKDDIINRARSFGSDATGATSSFNSRRGFSINTNR